MNCSSYQVCPFAFNSLGKHLMELIQMCDIVKGGIVPAMRLSKNRILHFYGDSVEITNNKLEVKETFTRVGRLM